MAKITNKGARSLGFPSKASDNRGPGVPTFTLHGGESRDVPEWYAAILTEKRGIKALVRDGALSIEGASKSAAKPEKKSGQQDEKKDGDKTE
jgi:hypothetical protein